MKTLLIPTLVVALTTLAHADAPKLDGKLDGPWCEPDTKVGCYTFKGKAVTEESVTNSKASAGTWMQDEDMLVMTFKEGPWALQLVKSTPLLKDLSRKLTYTFTRR